jgi:hypothetical protein
VIHFGHELRKDVNMAPVINVTRGTLLRRRRAIYSSLGMSPEEFEATAETRTLSGDEWDAKEELESIAYLLGETSS